MTVRDIALLGLVSLVGMGIAGCDPEKVVGEAPENKSAPVNSRPVDKKPDVLLTLAESPSDGDEVAVLETGEGQIVVMFYPEVAPKSVERFKMLVKSGFYNGTRFHRTIRGFMIQGGDPNSKKLDISDGPWGTGGYKDDSGAEVPVPDEFSSIKHARGIISMANSGFPNSQSSQFFIVVSDSVHLDGKYSAFGKVVSGMDVADKIVGTPVSDDNGTVFPEHAVLVKKTALKTWPLD